MLACSPLVGYIVCSSPGRIKPTTIQLVFAVFMLSMQLCMVVGFIATFENSVYHH